ncbi:DeoR/GlpR family DNA-binding transcription regulator [Tuberibacillus sp. Marseille-P3662]|uniref:DeoR/GlpR family DNA-binding transcription regulator n=1 Tax=Tuberibacillus sp. Marseille-P3662 TaxID=1965358 RepID=UPI000A1CC838|nr:DeoR/GlpR family DNA-binding transcription regulator [Tuberibacillus sp. Marseille-P3662]
MNQAERMIEIVNYLKKHKRVRIEDICQLCEVSRDTARRDLVKLDEAGAIIRTRGGALLPSLKKEVKGFEDRLHAVSEEKRGIGQLAAQLVSDDDNNIMDTSTTVQACAEYLSNINFTVVTNSINLADRLTEHLGVNIHLLGGQLNKQHRYLYGPSVIKKLDEYRANKAFIGVLGITERGITSAHEDDGFVKNKMMEQADQVIVLADHSKFGLSGFYKFASLTSIDLIITDIEPNKEILEMLDQHGVEVLAVDQRKENLNKPY